MSANLNYGIIGNCKSAALINEDTSIDWLCLPQFDSPSVFAKILDNQKGGHFLIKNLAKYTIKQTYLENTNILRTEFRNDKAGFEVILCLDIKMKLIFTIPHQRLSGLFVPFMGHPPYQLTTSLPWNMLLLKQRLILKRTLL